jgi:hypothetical protein
VWYSILRNPLGEPPCTENYEGTRTFLWEHVVQQLTLGTRCVGICPVKSVEVIVEGAKFRGRSGLGEQAESGLAGALWALRPSRYLRRVPNRETLLVDITDLKQPVHVDGADPASLADFAHKNPQKRLAVLKRHRGGASRDAWFEMLHRGPLRSPARREAENLAGLALAGVSVPAPLAYWESSPRGLTAPGSRFWGSLLLMEYLPHRETLHDLVWAGDSRARPLLGELAGIVGDMHGAGWYHRDLYMEHVILSERGLAILDAGRARQQARPLARWFEKDLAALWTSRSPELPKRANMQFLYRWGQTFGMHTLGRGLTVDELRCWLPRIGRRGKKLLAHAPRHVHADPPAKDE